MAELTLGLEIAADDAPGIAAWLARHHVEGPDARALTRDFPRLLVYQLVQRQLAEALRAAIPRTLARLGPHFEAWFAEFLAVSPPVTRYLRDLTPQFLRFAQQRWARRSRDPRIPR